MKVISSADLGGLGEGKSLPATVHWTLPSLTPLVLPWLGLVALLALKPNRHAGVWLILVPCLLVVVSGAVLEKFVWDDAVCGPLVQGMTSVSFGLAASWLLAPLPAGRGKTARSLLQAAGVSALALLYFRSTALWEELGDSGWSPFPYLAVVFCILYGIVWSFALMAASLWCKKRFTLGRVWFSLPFTLFAGWACASALSTLVAWALFRETPDWAALPKAALGLDIATYVAAIPFLLLSSVSRLYRERLRQLLSVAQRSSWTPELIPGEPLARTSA